MDQQQVDAPPRPVSSHARVPEMSVILVGWNNRQYLEPCLDSLYRGNLNHTFDVVVVDNGSTDGSQAMLRERFPQVRVVENGRNVGLAKASNQGIEATHGHYVLLLNNDTLVDGRSLDAMVDYLDDHASVAAVGGRLLNPDQSFQAGFAGFSTLTEELLIATHLGELLWEGYPSSGDANQVRQVGWMSSACLLLRRSALDQVGVLDEGYFIYGDEADLQFRLHRAGWHICYLPYVTTIHYGGRSMDRWRRRKMVYRGKMLFYKKNYGRAREVTLRAMFGTISLTKLAIWGVASLSSNWRDQARKEIQSNLDVMRLCYRLE